MIMLTRWSQLIVAAPFVILLCIPVNAATITIDVVPHKNVVVRGEPLFITATVANESSEPVKLIHHNVATLTKYPLSVVDLRLGSDEGNLAHWSDLLRPIRETEPSIVAPEKTVSFDLIMLYNRESGFFATAPGKYWIQGRVVIAPSPYVEILTTPVGIEVRETPRAERAVWGWLNEHKDEYGRLVQVPWEAKLSDEFVAECDRICTQTNSLYGEYLAYFLSRWYREGPNKDAAKSQRFAEIAKTKATSEKVRTEAEKLLTSKQSD